MLAIYLFTSATFCSFILEESLQCYGFGVMSLVMNDDWDMLREELPKYQAFHDTCQGIHYIATVLNPLTGYYFQLYFDADQRKIDIWNRQIERHDSRFRETVAGEVRKVSTNGDGTAIIAIDTGSVVQNVYIPFPEIITLPEPGELVQLECATKYIRGSHRLELVRMKV
ncbi:unnamed protein product [marine sediment metagenome]|uniref:Uncharacterized protein n=1 Tax=marine sediment metagenome TaxID=412755 RepID=X1EXP0_9ZZZZ